jgi:DeoR/GlpR family transcriptional regulator of sugar metabolism
VKVALHVVEARRDRLAGLLQKHRYLPVQQLCQRLNISEATARRDLTALVKARRITRTYGGALSDYSNTFASFAERQVKAEAAKTRIAEQALRFMEPGTTCYLDAGTTILFIADALRRHPVPSMTIVTNNLPVAETLAEIKGLEVHLIGGLLLGRQSVLLGDKACQGVRQWKFDLAFLGAEGMTSRGLFNSQEDVVRYQRIVAQRASRVAFCLDATKLGHEAAHFLLPWPRLDLLLTDATPKALKNAGIVLNQINSTKPKSDERT